MKKFLLFAAVAVLTLTGAGKKDKSAFSKENGATVVNTTEICKSVDGYNGPVPVKIYIRKNKVEKIEMLNNQEGPKYVSAVKKHLLEAWNGLGIKEATTKEIDAVTGATFTSKAFIENVRQGLDYYQKNK